MTEPIKQRVEARAREILAKAKGRPGAAMTSRQATLLAESQLRHEDALAAEYERGKEYGLREARRIAQLMSDNLEEDNPALDHVIAVIDARLSAKEGLK